jgi:hypothetical protein
MKEQKEKATKPVESDKNMTEEPYIIISIYKKQYKSNRVADRHTE